MKRPSREQLEALLREHESATRVADAVGCATSSVYRWIDMHGLRRLAGLSGLPISQVSRLSNLRPEGRETGGAENVSFPLLPAQELSLSDMGTGELAGPLKDTTVSFPVGLWKEARKLAIDEGVSAKVVVARALREYLERRRGSAS